MNKYYGLKNTEENVIVRFAPNNWKTEAGAKRWALKNGFTIKEETQMEKHHRELTERFIIVRDYFLDKDNGTSRAYKIAWKKPWKFYKEHTPIEAIEILEHEAKEL